MKKILVASDGSAAAERAVAFAAELARGMAAELLLLTVCVSVGDGDLERFSLSEHASVMEVLEAEARSILARARSIAEGKGVRGLKTILETGETASAILDCARNAQVDVIVVGKRGRGHLAGLLLGSVSQKLVSLAPAVVIVVP